MGASSSYRSCDECVLLWACKMWSCQQTHQYRELCGEAQVALTTWRPVCSTWLEILSCQKATEKKQHVTNLMPPPLMSSSLVYRIEWSCFLLELTSFWYFDQNDKGAPNSWWIQLGGGRRTPSSFPWTKSGPQLDLRLWSSCEQRVWGSSSLLYSPAEICRLRRALGVAVYLFYVHALHRK